MKRDLTRRSLFGLTAAAAAGIALDACSSSGSTTGSTTGTASQRDSNPGRDRQGHDDAHHAHLLDVGARASARRWRSSRRSTPPSRSTWSMSGRGLPQYTKLRTALTAGKGAPDLAQIEYQYIPTFTITNSLVDLRPYGAAANAVASSSTGCGVRSPAPSGEIYAYPQDTGPMGMLYREDIFAEARHRGARRPGTSSRRRPASCTPPIPASTSRTCRTTTRAPGMG